MAALALKLDSEHDSGHHVLRAWQAEVMRLSGIARLFATEFLGGGYMSRAGWHSAPVRPEEAVSGAPDHLFHRLELAGIYIDLECVAFSAGSNDGAASHQRRPDHPYERRRRVSPNTAEVSCDG